MESGWIFLSAFITLFSIVQCQHSFTLLNSYAYSNTTRFTSVSYDRMIPLHKSLILFSSNYSYLSFQQFDKSNGSPNQFYIQCDQYISAFVGDESDDTFYIAVDNNPGYFYNASIITIMPVYSVVAKFYVDVTGSPQLLFQSIVPMDVNALALSPSDGTVVLGGTKGGATLMTINSTTGATLWQRLYGPSSSVFFTIAVVTSDGTSRIYAAGTSQSGIGNSPPVSSVGGQDIIVLSVDGNGDNNMTTVIGTTDLDSLNSIKEVNNSLYLMGATQGYTLVQDGKTIGATNLTYDFDAIVIQLSPSNLAVQNFKVIGTTAVDFINGAWEDTDGNIKVFGGNGANFTIPGVEGTGNSFVAKFKQNLELAWLFQCEIYQSESLYAEPDSPTFYLLGPCNGTQCLVTATDTCRGSTCVFTPSPSVTPSASVSLSTAGSTGSSGQDSPTPQSKSGNTTPIIAGAVAGGGALLVGAALVAFFLVRRKKSSKQQPSSRDVELKPQGEGETFYQQIQVRPDTGRSAPSHEKVTEVEDIKIESKLGVGNFGEVYKGVWHGSTPVALKRLKDPSMFNEFLAEAQVLQHLSMPYIVRFFGIWTDKQDGSRYIVTEYMSKGSLRDFLDENEKSLRVEDLILLIKDIAAGMKFMASKDFIHRDVAARNILVKEEEGRFVAKVADFGLARLTQSNYYTKGGAFPIRWCSPEVLSKEKFSTKSDVWAFGVVVWEIFEFGKVPYVGKSNEEVCNAVLDGVKLPQPKICPQEIWNLVLKCWSWEPADRPTFDEVYSEISSIATNLGLGSTPSVESSTNSGKDAKENTTYVGVYQSYV